ncbi:hypothetical protein BJY01DRAFT_255999 [Aspergillus pseudoustus]|uniref:p-aminobenzoic acid synthase n=1 Tax=Aspergillus pseudoustus TaxID=1810923 RepID=A0ABR4IF61_9EURO
MASDQTSEIGILEQEKPLSKSQEVDNGAVRRTLEGASVGLHKRLKPADGGRSGIGGFSAPGKSESMVKHASTPSNFIRRRIRLLRKQHNRASRTRLGAEVTKIGIHDREATGNFALYLRPFDAVVLGPGPGHPQNPVDVGLISKLWAFAEEDLLPIFAICLGFQSLALARGAKIERLIQARHGLVTPVLHSGTDIFAQLGELSVTQYHSLRAVLSSCECVSSPRIVAWTPTDGCPTLVPLAWDIDDAINGPVLMPIRHVSKPFWGGRRQLSPRLAATELAASTKETQIDTDQVTHRQQKKQSYDSVADAVHCLQSAMGRANSSTLRWTTCPSGALTPTQLFEALRIYQEEAIMLDSQGHGRGEHSIMGILIPGQTIKECLNPSSEDHRSEPSNLEIETCPTKSPFWGGFMGYISYEAGLETIDVPAWPGATESQSNNPDVNFAFVQRSIVFDHAAFQIYVQSLVEDDQDWVIYTARQIAQLVQHFQEVDSQEEDTALNETLACARIMKPSEAEYHPKVLACQQYLSSGDSYELCLTDETTITFLGDIVPEF